MVYAPTAIFAMWIPGPLSAERAGTLVLEAASPRTNARTLMTGETSGTISGTIVVRGR